VDRPGVQEVTRAYYNEFDPKVAQWLRNLIAAGLIAPGDVDERSIEDVTPNDLRGYTQCHFFAGVGGWSLALRLAGIPDSEPVWTGSCPCQPFSAAGKSKGFADERHLWPAFHWLIERCRPAVVFGEQVASKDGLAWLDLVQADCQGTGYAFRAQDRCAAGVGAPHIRQRIYWMAYSDLARLEGWREFTGECADQRAARPHGLAGGVADHHGERCEGVGLCLQPGAEGLDHAEAWRGGGDRRPGPLHGFWRSADWLYCRDGKWRPVEPGTFPLVDGVPGRAVRLRAYGNAIVPRVAKAFIQDAVNGYL